MRKSLMKICSRDIKTSKNYVMETLTNFVSSSKKVFIHIRTLMIRRNLIKVQCHEKIFYSNLTMERITNTDYEYSKSFWYDFGLQNIDQYHDPYVQSDTLLLADIFGCSKKNA